MAQNEDPFTQPLPLLPPPSLPREGSQLQIHLDTIAHRLDYAFAVLPAAQDIEDRKRFMCGFQYEMLAAAECVGAAVLSQQIINISPAMQRAMNLATAGNDHLAELDAVKMLLSKSHTSQAADDRLENAWWLLDRPGIFPPMTYDENRSMLSGIAKRLAPPKMLLRTVIAESTAAAHFSEAQMADLDKVF